MSIRTEDGALASKGDVAFNYYDMKLGTIAEAPDAQGWFTFTHNDGTSALLNGERICSLGFAARKGWCPAPWRV